MRILTFDQFAIRLVDANEPEAPLLPWIGPALRGTIAGTLKDAVCRHPLHERVRWETCKGCPLMDGCAYGELYEPDRWPAAPPARGGREPPRALVLWSAFPCPDAFSPGLRIPLRLTAIGDRACGHVDAWFHSLHDAARRRTLGRGGIRFQLDLAQMRRTTHELRASDFASAIDASAIDASAGVAPRVGVGLTSPLVLTERSGPSGRKEPVLAPTFAQLFRAALFTLSDLFALNGETFEVDFAGLCEAARRVPMAEHCYEWYEQRRSSTRHAASYDLRAAYGGGVYEQVPWGLIPYLVWGGRLHVGARRVEGAGAWRVVLE